MPRVGRRRPVRDGTPAGEGEGSSGQTDSSSASSSSSFRFPIPLWQDRYHDADSRDVGKIVYKPDINRVLILVKHYSTYEWRSIRALSKAKLEENQPTLASMLTTTAQKLYSHYENTRDSTHGPRKHHKHRTSTPPPKKPVPTHDDFSILAELYDDLPVEKKEAIREKYAHTAFVKNRCTCCDSFMSSSYTCIHSDCIGMCKTCHGNSIASGVDTCPACKKEQTLECPICTETKKPDQMLMGKHCSHGVCLSCFAESFRCKKTISNCPMCRAAFH